MTAVEVKCPETFSYYTGYITDVSEKDGKLRIRYEDDWKPAEWVEPSTVRPTAPPFDVATFRPETLDKIECRTASKPDQPFSWWEARVIGGQGEFFKIEYVHWDESYNEVVELCKLRPANAAPHFEGGMSRAEIPLPPELVHNMVAEDFADLVAASGLFCVSIVANKSKNNKNNKQQKGKNANNKNNKQQNNNNDNNNKQTGQSLLVIGPAAAVKTATLLSTMNFKYKVEIERLKKRKLQHTTHKAELNKLINDSTVLEFSVRLDLVGLAIGKKGANITAVEKMPGVQSVRIKGDGSVVVVADTHEAAVAARERIEFVEDYFAVPRAKVGRIVGQGFQHIHEIERNAGVLRITIADGGNGGRGGRNNRNRGGRNNSGHNTRSSNAAAPADVEVGPNECYNFKTSGSCKFGDACRFDHVRGDAGGEGEAADEDTVDLAIVGTRAAVDNAKLLLEHHIAHLAEMAKMTREERELGREVSQLSMTVSHNEYLGAGGGMGYGRGGGRGGFGRGGGRGGYQGGRGVVGFSGRDFPTVAESRRQQLSKTKAKQQRNGGGIANNNNNNNNKNSNDNNNSNNSKGGNNAKQNNNNNNAKQNNKNANNNNNNNNAKNNNAKNNNAKQNKKGKKDGKEDKDDVVARKAPSNSDFSRGNGKAKDKDNSNNGKAKAKNKDNNNSNGKADDASAAAADSKPKRAARPPRNKNKKKGDGAAAAAGGEGGAKKQEAKPAAEVQKADAKKADAKKADAKKADAKKADAKKEAAPAAAAEKK